MKATLALLLGLALLLAPSLAPAQQALVQDFEALRARVEEQAARQSYALALRELEAAGALELRPREERWVDFARADLGWRDLAASEDPDPSALEAARGALDAFLSTYERPEQRDELWARTQESKGDSRWLRRNDRNRGLAFSAYGEALEFWASSPDLDTARARYLELVWRMVAPADASDWELRQNAASLPEDALLGAQRLASSPEERARANYYLALRGERQAPSERVHSRTREAFEAVLAAGRETSVYADALYTFGVWLEERGELHVDSERGAWTEPDYVAALGLYRRLLEEYRRGTHEHWNDAEHRVRKIVSEEVSLTVDQVFLPGSEVRFGLRWRNLEEVGLALHPVDLGAAVAFEGEKRDNDEYLETIDLARFPASERWTHATGDEGLHRRGHAQLEPPVELTPGAYVIEARAGQARSRELILVSDAALVVKAEEGRLLAWFADVHTGEPAAGAELVLWEREQRDTPWVRQTAVTGEDGLASLSLEREGSRRHQYFLSAGAGPRQAFALAWEPWRHRLGRHWKIYATADRGAYRPGQTVSFKFTARVREEQRTTTPARASLRWELWGPTGEMHAAQVAQLNEFGSAWGSLEPDATWPLGEYQLRFFEPRGDEERGESYGGDRLFRLEEYKLPEFQVAVARPSGEDGAPRRYRMGDVVEMVVSADYYFGGPVSEATADVRVYRKPFYKRFSTPREFPWFHAEPWGPWQWNRGPGELVQQETLRVDAQGELRVSFETSSGESQDYEYRVEARVTDSSRREVTGSGTVRVTHQGFFAHLSSQHAIHAPGTTPEVELSTRDADDLPLSVEGEVTLLRLVWREVWIDPRGRRFEGEALRRLRSDARVFPPVAKAGELPWRPVRRDYEEVPLETAALVTDDGGRALWSPRLPSAGHYVVRYAATDSHGAAVTAELALQCADEGTDFIGLHSESARLILDRDTFREGEPGLVMISTPASGRWVLFTVESDGLLEERVVHVPGNVKLLRLDVDERWLPNVRLGLASFHEGRGGQDWKEVIVPPRKHFLELELELVPDEVLPGAEGELRVVARDHEGRPVRAEVGLSLVDASVDAIQGPYAMDPRQFFYGDRRPYSVATQSSTDWRAYGRLVRDAEGKLVDEREAWRGLEDDERSAGQLRGEVREQLRSLGYAGGGPSGGFGGPSDSIAPSSAMAKGGRMAAAEADGFFLGLGEEVQRAGVPLADGAGVGGETHVQVRSDFRETALWLPDLVTDADGRGSARFTYPESLTRWKARARAATSGADFGQGEGESATRLPLVARLQLPRFLVEGDEAVVSLNVDNRTEGALAARCELEVEGLEVLAFLDADGRRAELPESVPLPAGGGARLDWRVRATETGTARFVARVRAGEHADGVERSIPVEPHGIPSLVVKAGRIDGEGIELALELPDARQEGTTRMQVSVTPSLAVTMLDALPYLVDYPYGCTEQTLSRFVPAVVVRGTLERLGLDPELAMGRAWGGVEGEYAERTQQPTKAEPHQLERVTREGLRRLDDFQHADGSWSWWKHGEGDRFMTAYVVWGLSLAREPGVDVDRGKLDAGGQWLGRELVSARKDPALQAWMLHAHAAWLAGTGDRQRAGEQRAFADAACDELLERRVALNAYGRALTALAAHALGREADARLLVDNLIDGVQRDDAPDASIIPLGGAAGGTQAPRAHWGEDGIGYRWSDGGVEATAFALRALVSVDPEHELVQPAAEWLLSNRRGAQWSNTKTTAIVVLALSDYLERTGQLARRVAYALTVNGRELARFDLEPQEILSAPALVEVPPELLRTGTNDLRIELLSGEGPLYFSARAEFFSREEPVPPRGNEIFVRRQYFRLAARPTLLRGTTYERVPLEGGDAITSGERVEVVLTFEAKNHLEYLLFEDLKPAGFEATGVKSGEPSFARELRADEVRHRFDTTGAARTGRGARSHGESFHDGATGRTRSLHQELRDRQVAFFLDRCPEGVWEIRYDLRAEVPGRFHALPLMAEAMYVPEIRANGAEQGVVVLDREDL